MLNTRIFTKKPVFDNNDMAVYNQDILTKVNKYFDIHLNRDSPTLYSRHALGSSTPRRMSHPSSLLYMIHRHLVFYELHS